MLIALSIKLNLDIVHLDVCTAFLNGFLEKPVFMRQPDGFISPEKHSTKVCRLKKAIYGLKQSSRAWNTRINTFLLNLGYIKSQYEPCLYIKRAKNCFIVIALYVDDLIIFSNSVSETNNLKLALSGEFKIKDLGEAKRVLGMEIIRDKDKGIIQICQRDYINKVLNKFKMENCKPVKTPMEVNPIFDQNVVSDKNYPYRNLIGSLMYLVVLTRPDLCYSISFLSQYNNCYNSSHWTQAKRVLQYLQKTKDYCLTFSKDDKEIEGFVDADWGEDIKDRKSYSGFVFKMSNGSISWESKKQKSVSLSSTEAEYVAISECFKEAIYLQNLCSEIMGSFCKVSIYNDSQSAQKLIFNPVFHKRTKHIDIRYHFIRDIVANDLFSICYMPSEEMCADVLTKSLSYIKHDKFIRLLGLS